MVNITALKAFILYNGSDPILSKIKGAAPKHLQ